MLEGEKFNWRLTAVWWILLFVAAMYLMLMVAANKTIVIADSSYGAGQSAKESFAIREELTLEATGQESGVFLIPLEKNTKAGNVVVESSYMDRELRIFIGGADEEFYAAQSVQGDVSAIAQAARETQESGVLLHFQMNSIYEFQTSMDGDMLKIRFFKPHELYKMVVVVDPARTLLPVTLESGEVQQIDVTEDVCKKLAEQWAMEDVKLYFTRTESRVLSDAECLKLVNQTEADIFIQLDLGQNEDVSQYGISGYYNANYFIPGFGNVEMADIVARNVTITTDNRAVGLFEAADINLLQKLQIPAAGVELGYISNEQERNLLATESYRQKLADGIIAAIKEVYTNQYE